MMVDVRIALLIVQVIAMMDAVDVVRVDVIMMVAQEHVDKVVILHVNTPVTELAIILRNGNNNQIRRTKNEYTYSHSKRKKLSVGVY